MPGNALDGRTVADRYHLVSVRGRGGMGTVWEAEDSRLGRRVAVKEIDLRTGDAGVRERALREARAAARVADPHLVTVFDAVEEDGRLFLVQELIDAPTLKEFVRDNGALGDHRAAQVGLPLAAALQSVHRAGVIHRDVKPSNVMLLPDGTVKLGDFGVARIAGDPDLTATGVVIGSPAYLAPEQAKGDSVTPAADWWSFAATLLFAAEGRPPFEGSTMTVLTRLARGEIPRVGDVGPLRPVLEGLFKAEPAERWSPAKVRSALASIAGDFGGSTATAQLPVTPPSPQPATSAKEPSRRPDVRMLVLTGGAVLAVILLIAVAAAALRGDGSPAPLAASEQPAAAEPEQRRFDEWTEYRDEETGYVVRYPDSWTVRDLEGTRTDFVDPDTGAYLRVDWTDEPGDSPEGAWEDLSARFADRLGSYEEIGIHPTEFKGFDAALWEYRYESDGAVLHAYNLGLVTEDFGFALNFQAPEEVWTSYAATWEQLKDGFEPVNEKADDDGDDRGEGDDDKGEEGDGKGNGNEGNRGKGND